jgi:hypothetical protein
MIQPAQPQSLSQIAAEFAKDIAAGDLRDILESVRVLKSGSGWGKITITYLNSELDMIDISITRKRKKKTDV